VKNEHDAVKPRLANQPPSEFYWTYLSGGGTVWQYLVRRGGKDPKVYGARQVG
jgi:hypothetical protein